MAETLVPGHGEFRLRYGQETLYVDYPTRGSIRAVAVLRDQAQRIMGRYLLQHDPPGEEVVKIGNDHILMSWDMKTGTCLNILVTENVGRNHGKSIKAMGISPYDNDAMGIYAIEMGGAEGTRNADLGLRVGDRDVQSAHPDYGKEVGFSPDFSQSPIVVWKEKIPGMAVDTLVVDTKIHPFPSVVQYMRFPDTLEVLARLMRSNKMNDEQWRVDVADLVREARLQAIDRKDWKSTSWLPEG